MLQIQDQKQGDFTSVKNTKFNITEPLFNIQRWYAYLWKGLYKGFNMIYITFVSQKRPKGVKKGPKLQF